MKKLFIWFHRRRAAHHDAVAILHTNISATDNKLWHERWRDWHIAQLNRLEAK